MYIITNTIGLLLTLRSTIINRKMKISVNQQKYLVGLFRGHQYTKQVKCEEKEGLVGLVRRRS